MLPELLATIFMSLLVVALAAVLLSSVLFRNAPPLKRSALTAACAWLVASALSWFLPRTSVEAWVMPAFFLPFAIVVWLLMWRSFAIYWEDDAEGLAEEREVPLLPNEAPEAAGPRFEGPQPHRNWILRHWRGECPLPIALWINSVLVVFLISLAAAIALSLLEASDVPLQAVSAAALLFILVTLLLMVWGGVGAWRSATLHEDRGGSGSWAIAAQVVIVLAAFGAFLQIKGQVFQSWEYGVLAMGGDPLGAPADVTLANGGTAIRIDGVLTSGTSGRFRALAAEAPRLRTVLLDSPGGRQIEAMRIAATLGARQLDTRVERECLSACTFVLLAGRERGAARYARIGFHQPTFPGWSDAERRIAARRMRDDYVHAGLDPGFVDRAMETPNDAIWMPPHETLIAARVLTSTEIDTGPPALFEQMERLAGRINQTLPAQIDRTTRFDSVDAYGPVLVHNFTVQRPRRSVDFASARISIGHAARRQVCAVEANREAIVDGANYVFLYRDAEARPMFQITIDRCPA